MFRGLPVLTSQPVANRGHCWNAGKSGVGLDQFDVERDRGVDNHEHTGSDNLRVRIVVIELDKETVLERDSSRQPDAKSGLATLSRPTSAR